MKIDINEATATQLATFANVNLGLDVNLRMGSDKIRAVMAQAGYVNDSIDLDEEGPVASLKAPVSVEGRKMIKIMIPEQEGAGGNEPVFLSVNGKAMLVPRAKECEIPYPYFVALKNAEKVVYPSNPDGGLGTPRNVPQYPYNVLGGL